MVFIDSTADVLDGHITVERMMERLRERFEGQWLQEP